MKDRDVAAVAVLIWLLWPRPQGSADVTIGPPTQYGEPGETLGSGNMGSYFADPIPYGGGIDFGGVDRVLGALGDVEL